MCFCFCLHVLVCLLHLSDKYVYILYSNAIISELDDCPKLIRNVSCCQQVISAHNTPALNNGLGAEEWFLIFCLSNVHRTLFNLICKRLSENLLLQSACYFVPKEVKSRTDTNQIPWRSQWMGGAIISYLAVANWSNSVPFFLLTQSSWDRSERREGPLSEIRGCVPPCQLNRHNLRRWYWDRGFTHFSFDLQWRWEAELCVQAR